MTNFSNSDMLSEILGLPKYETIVAAPETVDWDSLSHEEVFMLLTNVGDLITEENAVNSSNVFYFVGQSKHEVIFPDLFHTINSM